MFDILKWGFLFFIGLVGLYLIFRIVASAIFHSYYEAKSKNALDSLLHLGKIMNKKQKEKQDKETNKRLQ